MESTGTKKTVEKKVIKVKMYGEKIKEAFEQEDISNLSPLCNTTSLHCWMN